MLFKEEHGFDECEKLNFLFHHQLSLQFLKFVKIQKKPQNSMKYFHQLFHNFILDLDLFIKFLTYFHSKIINFSKLVSPFD